MAAAVPSRLADDTDMNAWQDYLDERKRKLAKLTDHELSVSIADNGGWEEFHQKRHHYTMYDHHKARRLELEAEYRRRHGN